MNVEFFKQDLINTPYLEAIKKAIDEMANGGSNIVNGKYSKDFETLFAKYVGSEYCAFLSNGLNALKIALQCIGIENDDEILVPNHTYITTWISVLQVGAKIVAVPVKENNLLMDENQIENYITSKTKCIMPVHLYGNIVNMKKIREIANNYNLYIIDDAAQAHGSEVSGKKLEIFLILHVLAFIQLKI